MDQKKDLLKIDFKEVGPFAKLGKNLNAIGRMLNNIHFIDGGEVLSTKDFIRLRTNADTTTRVGSFDVTQGGTNLELLTITDGWLNVHGIAQEYIAATDVVLAGGPFVFVYLWALTNDYTTNGIAIANGATVSDIPVSGSGRFNVVLWQYELDLVTGKYGSPVARSGGQDVNLMTPVRN